MTYELVDLEPGDPRLVDDMLPVLAQLRFFFNDTATTEIYTEGHPQGLRFLVAYAGDRCVGVAGWRMVALTFAVRKLYVDDLVTTADGRSQGVGHALLAELESRARAAGCTVIDLDSGVQRHDAHRFYFRERMHISSHHFTKALDG